MANEQTCPVRPQGVIGVTDDGYPIVTGEYGCIHWQAGTVGLCAMRECWYCRYADFRKTTDAALARSICRCPYNRMNIRPSGKNELLEEEVIHENHT